MSAIYVAVKLVQAEPMTRGMYCDVRGWTVPADENPTDAGYLTVDLETAPNVPGWAGYVSWAPAAQFEQLHRSSGNLSFSQALELLRRGNAIARAGWNGVGMFAYLVPANAYPASTSAAKAHFGDELVQYNAYMALKGADGRVSTWAPSTGDVLADDWSVYVFPDRIPA